MTWGITNWQPRWHRSTATFVADVGEPLRQLIGTKLVRGWLLWDVDQDEWWNDAPVVLEFEHASVEICATEMTDLSLTRGQVATDEAVAWCGCAEPKLEWRASALPMIRAVEGTTLRRVHVVEHAPPRPNILDGWVLVGVEFEFADGVLAVSNGLDENRLDDRPLENDEYRRSATIP